MVKDQRDPREVEKALNDENVEKEQGESGRETGKRAAQSNKNRAKRPK